MSLYKHLITPRKNEAIDTFRSTPSLSHRSRLHKMTDIIFDSGNVSNGEHNLVDVHVGSRVRSRRISAGISEQELRAALGLTAEQLRAYESGATRIGASLLYDVSKLLECLPKVFFEDMK